MFTKDEMQYIIMLAIRARAELTGDSPNEDRYREVLTSIIEKSKEYVKSK